MSKDSLVKKLQKRNALEDELMNQDSSAKDRAFSKLRELINGYMLDENVPQKKIKKSYFNPETGEYEYEYE